MFATANYKNGDNFNCTLITLTAAIDVFFEAILPPTSVLAPAGCFSVQQIYTCVAKTTKIKSGAPKTFAGVKWLTSGEQQ